MVSNTVQIGGGCHLVQLQDGDILLATTPDADGSFTSLRISKSGEIRVNERLIASDEEARHAVLSFLKELGIHLVQNS